MARWMVAGLAVAAGRNRSKAQLTAVVRVARKSCREKGLGKGEARRLMVTDMRGCCRESRTRVQAHLECLEYLYCVRGLSSYCTSLESKHLRFERRICKKGIGEGWQPQRSGQLDFTDRKSVVEGKRVDL